jgi:hypothetical protein
MRAEQQDDHRPSPNRRGDFFNQGCKGIHGKSFIFAKIKKSVNNENQETLSSGLPAGPSSNGAGDDGLPAGGPGKQA